MLIRAFFADSFMQRHMQKMAVQHLKNSVADPELRAKLTPIFNLDASVFYSLTAILKPRNAAMPS